MVMAAAHLFEIPNWPIVGEMTVRLLAAALLGGIIGWEREKMSRAAGLRTHVLVAIACAMFVLGAQLSGTTTDGIARVIQGIAGGIGFLGAGTIIKLTDRAEVQGLTTAAGIFATAAIGVAAASTPLWLPVLGTTITLIVLRPMALLEQKGHQPTNPHDRLGHR